jgi:hypothetical protein
MEESYPAIDRVLDLLRIRLNVNESDRRNRLEETAISFDSLGDAGLQLKDEVLYEPEAHHETEVFDRSMFDERIIPTTSSATKKCQRPVFSLRKINSLVARDLEIALKQDDEMRRKLKLRRQLIEKIDPSYRISSTKLRYELFMVFSQWKECFLNKKRTKGLLNNRRIVNMTDRCSFLLYLPEKQQQSCVEKYGKIRLASLFHLWKTKRKVFRCLVKSYLAVTKNYISIQGREID